ncbi:MAG: hypothetical protein LIO91_12665 [Bacteroidales bacterium]|nr:hypothetical protein [Bacteroidales bacterium]
MKLTAFSVGLALSCIGASATDYTISVNENPSFAWTTGLPDAGNARQMALSNNTWWTIDVSTGKLYKALKTNTGNTEQNVKVSFTETCVKFNYKIAADDEGNLVLGYNSTAAYSITKNIRILPKSATPSWTADGYKDIDIYNSTSSLDYSWNTARADFIGAAGNLLSSDGGSIFIWPNGSTKYYRLRVKSGVVKAIDAIEAGATADATAHVTPTRNEGYKVGDGPQSVLTQSTNRSQVFETVITKGGNIKSGPTKVVSSYVPNSAVKAVLDDDRTYYVWCSSTYSGNTATETSFTVMDAKTGATYKRVIHTDSYNMANAYVGLWIDVQFNDAGTQLQVWCYQPGKGAWLYRCPITECAPAPAAINGSIEVQTNPSILNRQDGYISWTPSEDGYTSQLYRSADGSTWSKVYEGIDCEYVEKDMTSTYLYKACYVVEGKSSSFTDEITLAPKFLPSVPQWIDGGQRYYDGFSKVQLIWKWAYGYRPGSYNVYRDGYLIAEGLTVTNYIDRLVPEGVHTYYIESCYSNYPDEHGQSTTWEIEMAARDAAYQLYGLDEVYNFEIDSDTSKNNEYLVPNSRISQFYDQNLYRQGVMYGGYWFIAQRENALTYNIDGEQQPGETSEYGSIVRMNPDAKIDGTTTSQAIRATAKTMVKLEKCTNVGLAVDEDGVFFVRKANSSSVWDFSAKLTAGYLIQFEDALTEGDPVVKTKKEIDLSSLGITTRCDYYSMTGHVLTAEGGYLYLAPHNSTTVYRAHIVNGVLKSYDTFNHKSTDYWKSMNTSGGTENYAFQLAERDDIIHCLRSHAVTNVDLDKNAGELIYQTYSRVNNAGGTSAWYKNDLLLITPEASTSKNVGDFTIARGYYAGAASKAENASDVELKFESITPIISWAQNPFHVEVENANGIWLETSPAEDNSCLYIYLYVPGVRMAKYRLYPYVEYPSPQIELDVHVAYEYDDDGNAIDIKSFHGVATWPKIEYGSDETDMQVDSYTLRFLDSSKNVVDDQVYVFDSNGICTSPAEMAGTSAIAESAKASTKATTKDDDAEPTTFSYEIYDLDSQVYTAEIVATYVNNSTGELTDSEPSISANVTDYDPDYPEGTVTVVKENNIWQREDGTWHRNFRLDIDFDKPDNYIDGVDSEPVTYYELYYKRVASEDWTRITWMYIANGDGTWTCVDPDNIEGSEAIVEGTFDFENGKNTEGDRSMIVRVWWQPEVTTDGELVDEKDDPYQFTYMVRARYAARAVNKSISKSGDGIMVTADGATTGVQDLDCVDCQEEGPAVYYDLQGRRVLDPTCRHIYIKVHNGKATKEIPTNN